jgi:1-acyl-sn-glycerol-3-phosphate acyltransferase
MKLSKSYKFWHFCARFFSKRYSVCHLEEKTEPVVYLVHHQNLRGPILSVIWYDTRVHPWVLSVFLKRKTCFKQFCGYYFQKRVGLPKAIAAVLSFPLSFFVTWLMHLIQAIPVFRGSKEIITTFRQSINALLAKDSILICPDKDYTNKGTHVGEMYSGFLDLEKIYFKRTGEHLAFIPLYISKKLHRIYSGRAVRFENGDFEQEKAKVYDRIKDEFLFLESKDN